MSRTFTRIAQIGATLALNYYAPVIGNAALGAMGTAFAGLSPGLAAGLVNVATALGSVGLAAANVAAVSAGASLLGIGPKIPRPDVTETAIKSPTPPRTRLYGRRRIHPNYALYETAQDGTAADAYAFLDSRADAIEGYYMNDDIVTLTGSVVDAGADGRYKDGAINLYVNMGLDTETAFTALTTLLPTIWTSNHRGDGVVTGALTAKAVKDKDFLETYPNGVPVPSIIFRGLRCYDWRDDGQDIDDEDTWTWTENGVLHTAHFMMTQERLNEPEPLPIDEWFAQRIAPQLSYWTAAADDCETTVALKDGGTEPRYRSCVAYAASSDFKGIRGELMSTYDGWIGTAGDGSYIIYSGRYYTPTVSLGADEIVSYAYRYGIADEDAYDEFVVSYVSEAHDWNTVETDRWIIREGDRSDAFSPQTPSYSQNRRLAKRKAFRIMAEVRGTATTNVGGRIARGQRFINLTLADDDGFTVYSGPVEILGLTRNYDTGGVTFDWVATSAAIDEWNPATEQGDPAANGDRVELTGLEQPEIDAVTIVDGPRLSIDATGPDREDLTWFVRTRVTGTTEWGTDLEYSDAAPGAAVTLLTDIVPQTDLDVQVSYAVGDGRHSPYSVEATTNAAVVNQPVGFAVTPGIGQAALSWTNPASGIGTYYRAYRGTTNVFGSATQIYGAAGALNAPMSYTDTPLVPGVYYFWVRAFGGPGLATAATPTGPISVTVT